MRFNETIHLKRRRLNRTTVYEKSILQAFAGGVWSDALYDGTSMVYVSLRKI
jgi:hypothetical protein